MANPPNPTALGPYTAWMYGPGRAYDFFASDRGRDPHYLSGILERPGGHEPTPNPAPLNGGGATASLYAPSLWPGLASPRFVPFIMSGQLAHEIDGSTLDALWRSAATVGVTVPGGDGLGPKSGSTTSINAGFPVRKDDVVEAATGDVALSADPAVDTSKPIVVIGIIDDGIPFANRRFDGPGGRTRIDACWMQGMAPDGSGRVRFGREVTGDDIAALRATHGADEDVIYRAAGALGGKGRAASPLIGDVAHGAHTLGALAAGSDAQVRIVAVDLPPAATWDTSGYGRDMVMLAGLHYIFDRADKIAAAYGKDTLPMVVNISYGYSGGSHDGGTTLEAAFDELMEARRAKAPTGFTLPSGNMYLDSTHAVADVPAGEAMAPLPWRVAPDDRTSSFLECWLPAGVAPQDAAFTLYGPGPTYGGPGPVAAIIDGLGIAGQTQTSSITWNAQTVGQLSVDQGRSGRWRYLIALAPTDSSTAGHAPSGLWKIVVKNKGSVPMTLRFWIQRDISYGRGFTGARQSYFDEPANQLFTKEGRLNEEDTPGAMTARKGTLNGMATGATSLVVGAGKGWGSNAELYSCAARDGETKAVEASAMVTKTLAEVGRLSGGVRTGPRVRLTGTSVSAPAIGAALRDLIAAQPAGTPSSNYADALDQAGLLKDVDPPTPDRLGRGVLE
ncbi:MAG: hypothetical protein AAGH70_10320 [Pseudomonadota bacterium]